MASTSAGVPSALLHNIKHNEVLHARNVLVTVLTAEVPHVAEQDRIEIPAFLRRLALARDLGYAVVWTAHNVLPHRDALRPLHVLIRRRMMTQADAVIVHCQAGRRELLARFPRNGPTAVIPIGSYAGLYPGTADRPTARARLGLDSAAFVHLALGNIAAYKGLELSLIHI